MRAGSPTGMHYCYDGGGHICWAPLRQVRTGTDQNGRPITELICTSHAGATA